MKKSIYCVAISYRAGSGLDYSMPTNSTRLFVEAEGDRAARDAAIARAYESRGNISHVRVDLVAVAAADTDLGPRNRAILERHRS
jgi:hypothetical protein